MSNELIDSWLDDEVSDKTRTHLEEWLRDDPENLQNFFDAVRLQEDLRAHYGDRLEPVTLPSQKQIGRRLIIAMSTVAAIITVGLFISPNLSGPQATDDPLAWVMSGNPQIEITRMDPGPNPFPIPREQWPMETRVAASDEPVSLRWDEGCVLEAEAGTVFMLRSANEQVVPAKPRSVQFESGTLTVRIEPPPVPADILVGDSRIRASQPTVFTLKDSGRQPLAHEVTLSVVIGEILLLRGDGGKRTVTAGEDVEVP